MAKHTWDTVAEVVAKHDPSQVRYKIDRNELGHYRCSCMSFRFCKLVSSSTGRKFCKHTLAIEAMPPVDAATKRAQDILTDVLDAGGLLPYHKSPTFNQMVTQLKRSLATLAPLSSAPSLAPQTRHERMITLED